MACVVLSERTESLDLTSVASDFVSVNSRRLNYENISTLFVFTDFMFIIAELNYIIIITMFVPFTLFHVNRRLKRLDNHSQYSVEQIGSDCTRSDLRASVFLKFSGGGMPPDPLSQFGLRPHICALRKTLSRPAPLIKNIFLPCICNDAMATGYECWDMSIWSLFCPPSPIVTVPCAANHCQQSTLPILDFQVRTPTHLLVYTILSLNN